MKQFPDNVKFKYVWRKYQHRVLTDLQHHLQNNHLHVIAPPGSGKTVLGLEVALRLNKPTLILTPTLAIRNQWIQRFTELFLGDAPKPDWISHEIKNPKFLTVTTYQALHSLISNKQQNETETANGDGPKSNDVHFKNLVSELALIGTKTLVLDEAHHLKNEWWKVLMKLKTAMNLTVVSLTATPPYDDSAQEWERYVALNGPIDTEISVPELVVAGDLCPHQDFVYFTLPTISEQQTINEFRTHSALVFEDLSKDKTLIHAVSELSFITNPLQELDWIYNNLKYYSACILFLYYNKFSISETHLEVIGDKNAVIPRFDTHWLEILLDFYLFQDYVSFDSFTDHKKRIEHRLRRNGIIEHKQINFTQNNKISTHVKSSLSKLNGIKDIVEFEYKHLKNELRLVILTDYIRLEFLDSKTVNHDSFTKIGIIPIFETLKKSLSQNIKLGVLSGSIVIVPKSCIHLIVDIHKQKLKEDVQFTPLSSSTDYVVINQIGEVKNSLIHIVTQIFQEGHIQVLIGTKSLLGEGWDAPAINSLVLASFVGSFVLSNQMRGRAIRSQRGNHNKTGNIWHLVCVDTTDVKGGDDLAMIKKRFKGFVGISYGDEPVLQNGIQRLNLPKYYSNTIEAEMRNIQTMTDAADRRGLANRWRVALSKGQHLVEEIKIPYQKNNNFKKTKLVYYRKSLGFFISTLACGIIPFTIEGLEIITDLADNMESMDDLYLVLYAVLGLGFIVFGRKFYLANKEYVGYRDMYKSLKSIGNVILNSLIKAEIIQTPKSEIRLVTEQDEDGNVTCFIDGVSSYEMTSFVTALEELLSPIDNPRYVISRKTESKLFVDLTDYRAVPEIIGRKKELALYFEAQWKQLVGDCSLIYTRSMEGRSELIASRIHSLTDNETKSQHLSIWK